ncbi:preprotein translocase subunit SecA [Patescibacteria group bacterium]
MGILTKILGNSDDQFIKKNQLIEKKISDFEDKFKKLSDQGLKNKTLEFKDRLLKESLDDILPEAFAVVREAAKRTLGQWAFDTQILGGIILHQGKIVEMKTGEGKTLTSTFPIYLNALTDKGVHVITVNDYLTRRDVVWMGQIYHALGLSVGCLSHESTYLYDPEHSFDSRVDQELDKERDKLGSFKIIYKFLKPCSRQEAYRADITYGTNNEFGFDYLRDSMAYQKEQLVQRAGDDAYNFAIVDEIDSVLIDEARTPLIISAPDEDSADLYKVFANVVPKLDQNDYSVDEKQKAASINDAGIEKIEKLLNIGDIYTEKGIKYVHHLNQALRARAIFKKDRDYVVKNNEIVIVDEFTGRMMPGRRWSEGLHQAIEAKEGVTIQKESRTMASITFQNYFRMYKKLSGMTGTALTSAEEFHKVYNSEVVELPTNRPLIRKDQADFVFPTEQGKFEAVVREVKERHQKGQPVLVGTVSIEKNEYLSALLKKEGVPHRLLNAKHHEEEGEIIAQAGKSGMVTVATNMAGRGVDIVLGGAPENKEQSSQVKDLGGLFVLGTERHEARRIDNQLRGRSGRQGDPGGSRFFVSLEDDLMRIFGSEKIKNMMHTMGVPDDQPIENKLVARAIESAQSKIEGMNFDARKHLLDYDDVMNKQRVKIYTVRREVLFENEKDLEKRIQDVFDKEGLDLQKLEDKKKDFGDDFFRVQKNIFLQVIDMLWVGHLEEMGYMRSSVSLRAYGNQDPLVEYKNEGLKMFKSLQDSVGATFVKLILNVQKKFPSTIPAPSLIKTSEDKKVGRNDQCPCGSGKKYKKCHGQ